MNQQRIVRGLSVAIILASIGLIVYGFTNSESNAVAAYFVGAILFVSGMVMLMAASMFSDGHEDSGE